MNSEQLQARLATAPAPVLLHVLPEAVFAANRIPGSLNACVYETAFPERAAELIPDRTTPVIVYGSGGDSLESRVAAERLREAGYRNVEEYTGGLAAHAAAGLPLEGSGELPDPFQPPDGSYAVDPVDSLIRWTGRNLFNHHSGTVRLAGGNFTVADGRLVAATFSIALESIACEDIADSAMNRMLVQHLHSADFFETANHPLATFEATSCTPIADATEGVPNFHLAGDFTLRGVTRPLEFPVLVATNAEGRVTGQAIVELDRTAHGSIYGSGKFFRYLGQHLVNDHVHLHLKIHAAPR